MAVLKKFLGERSLTFFSDQLLKARGKRKNLAYCPKGKTGDFCQSYREMKC
jgi:hypothetical protein